MENGKSGFRRQSGSKLTEGNGHTTMKDIPFPKLLLFVNALVPLVLLLWDVYHKRVGANPLEFVTRTTGMLTLVFLTLTLAVTPVRKITGLNWLVKFRRMLGLFAAA